MRRSDREVIDPQRIEEIIRKCRCCRLGLRDGERVYIVPLSFGYEVDENGGYTFYFHSAPEGRKIDLIRQTGYASFEMDTGYELRSGTAESCSWTAAYQSVFGEGQVSFIEGLPKKEMALRALMEHTAGSGNWTFSAEMLRRVCVFQLETETLSCKEHQ